MPATSVRLLSARDQGLPPDLELAARLYLPPVHLPGEARRSVPGLVVGHGAGSRAARHEQFCLEACRQGFAVLALDFRGHGDSQGQGDGPLEQDIMAATRFLREHPAVDPDHVCYRGSSLGGFYGLKAAPEARFAAMVLICPASEKMMVDALRDEEDAGLRDDTKARDNSESRDSTEAQAGTASTATRWDKPRLRAYFERQDTRALAAQVECPVLLVHARFDEQVPIAYSLLLARHLRTETTLLALASGSHTSAQHDPAIHSYTVAWLHDRVVAVSDQGK
jgi:dipeptidyl aminopeptidase/acylaminoacyl peptidase